MGDVAVIIPEAGLTRRLGERNKLLLPVNGPPMIHCMVKIYEAVTTRPVPVVTDHKAKAIGVALAGSGAKPIFNPDNARGQPTSVACGLGAAGAATTLLICLGDQPLLSGWDLRPLHIAHEAVDTSRISIPMLDVQRGNPIVIPGSLRARLLADPGSPGCKTLTRAHRAHFQFNALKGPGLYADADTPEVNDALNRHHQEETL